MNKSKWNSALIILLTGIFFINADLLFAAIPETSASPVAASISIISGPTVRISGITTPTVIQLSGYNTNYPVRWLRNGAEVGGGATHSLTIAGTYTAQVNFSTNPSNPFWVTQASIGIPSLSHYISTTGPTTLSPTTTTTLCLTSNASSYIVARNWLRNGVDENRTTEPTCRNVYVPGTYRVEVTYQFGAQTSMLTTYYVTLNPATQAPVSTVSKNTSDPVSAPPVLTVTNFNTFTTAYLYRNSLYYTQMTSSSINLPSPGRYLVAGMLSSSTYAYSTEIVITKGSIPVPSVFSDGGYELTYQDPDLRLSTQSNYNAGYTWYFNDAEMPGATTSFIDIYKPGNYKVKACATHSDGLTECKTSVTRTVTGETLFVNYVRKKTALTSGIQTAQQFDALPKEQADIYTSYFDGFVRPIQVVQKAYSPAGNDEVSFFAYDAFEREQKKYLPFVRQMQDGKFRHLTAVNSTPLNQFYQNTNDQIPNTNYPFSEMIYESSPLNRITEEAAPGEDWRPSTGHTVKRGYKTNKASDLVRLWKKDAQGMISSGHYAEGMLVVTEVTDEHGNILKKFLDKQGRTILTEAPGEGGTRLRSYQVYDDLNRLICVMPPLTSQGLGDGTVTLNETVLHRECFRFAYDERGRMIIKQMPGAESVFVVYDPWNREVLSQSGTQRAQGKWSFIKYDAMDRLIMSGEMSLTGDHQFVIEAVRNFYSAVDVNPSLRYEDQGNVMHGYTNRSYPVLTDATQAHTINYYDNYNFLSPSEATLYQFVPDPPLELTAAFPRLTGLQTGSKTLILGSQQYLKTINYYDKRYRLIQMVSDNHLSGIDRLNSQYDFTGKISKERKVHNGPAPVAILKEYIYDHRGRLVKTYHQINNEASVLLADHHYNELGKLTEKNLHEGNDGRFFQSLDYRHNIRGWVSAMNDAATEPNAVFNDLYAFELFYNESVPGINNVPQFNSNVSAFKQRRPYEEDNQGGEFTNVYNYRYDPANQLKRSDYLQLSDPSQNGSYDEYVTYDANGNINTLVRKGLTEGIQETIDQLGYTYSGNQLYNITDSGNPLAGFKDQGTSTDYSYDANGNLISDSNKSIASIVYNILNLPSTIAFSDGRMIRYTHTASGEKLKQEVFNADGSLKLKRDYIDNFIYDNDTLQEIQHTEGRVVPETPGATFTGEYQYHLKDHLGNVRATFTTDVQEDTYTAGLEDADMKGEAVQFNPSYEYAVRYNSTMYNHTPGGNRSQRLSAANDREIIGLAKSLKVMSGDRINMEAYGKYYTPTSNGTDVSGLILTAMSAAFGVTSTTGEGTAYQSLEALNNAGLLVHSGKGVDAAAPKTYLNYILFDKDFVVYDLGFDQISSSALVSGKETPHDKLQMQIDVKREGYIYVYLSNESEVITDVFFDDLLITHSHSPLIETTDYYPFGMISRQFSIDGIVDQPFKYNGKELQQEEGLDWYDYGARMYDAALGRWHVIDPMAEKYSAWSPYQYAMNNPIKFIDPDGEDVVFHTNDPTPKGKADPKLALKYLRASSEGKRILTDAQNNSNVMVYVSFRDGANITAPKHKAAIKAGATTDKSHPDISISESGGMSTLNVKSGTEFEIFNGLDVTADVSSGKEIYFIVIRMQHDAFETAEALGHELEAHVNLDQDKAKIEELKEFYTAMYYVNGILVEITGEDVQHYLYGADFNPTFAVGTEDGEIVPKVLGSKPQKGTAAYRLQHQLAKLKLAHLREEARKKRMKEEK